MTRRIVGRIFLCSASLGLSLAVALAATSGDGIYRVSVQSSPAGVGVGVYTATTGSTHPVFGSLGSQNVLFGGGIPGTSYTTIRSYTSGTDYVQRNGLTLDPNAPTTIELEGYVAAGEEALPVGDPNHPTGFTTIYRLGDVAAAPDLLLIRQTAAVVGTVFNDSAVMLRTEITNNADIPVSVGVRYLWDFQIGSEDDGPSFKTLGPTGAPLATDAVLSSPAFSTFEIIDDDDPSNCLGVGNSPFPFFAVQGSVNGPALLAPTPPTRLAYVSWPDASGLAAKVGGVISALNAFDYATLGVDVSSCLTSVDDTGVASWWGDSAGDALTIAGHKTVSVTAYIFAYAPGAPPTFLPSGVEGPPGDPSCSDGIDNDSDGLVDGADPDCLNTPPDCSAAAPSSSVLWPPNHKFKSVSVGGVTDADGDPVSITVNSISQDEPLVAPGDGHKCPDASGVGGDTASLRVERSGRLDGRVYHVGFTADDGNGGQCSGTVSVCVPHDRGKHASCVDQGALVDSTGPCAGKPPHGHGKP
ncbi:MAG: hypothetical protein HY049_01785 [Acidobacteria bacterium]|nr:hypothetical protein [Acidobacteriota bacterium]